jgi:excisionase family DNA binding protein
MDRLAAALNELVEALREELRMEADVHQRAPDRLLRVDEASAMLGLGRSRTYLEIQTGRLRSVKVGRRRLIPLAAVAEYIEERVA